MTRKKTKIFIFDFDGVIVDSFEIIYSVVRDAFQSIGIPLSPDDYRNFFLINPKLAEQKLCQDEKKFMMVQKFIHKNAPIRYRGVKIFSEISHIIPKIARTAKLAIVSSSQTDVIMEKLHEYRLKKYFSFILGADKDLSKIEKLNEIIRASGLPKESAYFISDTFGDICEGKKIGIKTIAVGWGFHSQKILKGAGPDYFAASATDLAKIMNISL